MRLLLTSEARFERTPEGAVWSAPAYGRALWARYLDVFSSVVVAGRVSNVRQPSSGSVPASSTQVAFCDLPIYSGLSGFVRHSAELRRRIASAVQESEAVIVRSPSPLAYMASRAASARGGTYGAEIVGDPSGVFSPGAYEHPLRLPIRLVATAAQRKVTRRAAAALYVTRDALQRRYPTSGRAFAASDVALDDEAFADDRVNDWRPSDPFVLVTVGAIDQPYKGTAVLLDAVAELRQRGAPVTLRIVGDGRLRTVLAEQAAAQGTSAHVEFLGQQTRASVYAALDSAHLFVLPSLTEGLPRALLEAMARGLPAVASDVGGIPELLSAECLVPPRDSHALAVRIERLMADAPRRGYLATRNKRHARLYQESAQRGVRQEFLAAVRDAALAVAGEACCA